MVQRMSVKLALLIAVSVFMSTADHATAANPMEDESVKKLITGFNAYRNGIFIPGMMNGRAYMVTMKQERRLMPAMTAKMMPTVREVMINNIQFNIKQPPLPANIVTPNW